MTMSYKQFFKILNSSRAKDSAITLENSIDKKLSHFTDLPNEEKTKVLQKQNGNIIQIRDTSKNITNLDRFDGEDFDYIKNKIVTDYSKAGWQVSWDMEHYPDGTAYYTLEIAR